MNANGSRTWWTASNRGVVFVLASCSITCLLVDFYGLCPMRFFTPFVFLPALLVLLGWALLDWVYVDGRLARAVLMGITAGLGAALAYDIFRLPFVFAKPLGIASVVPSMNLFKVFPGFGAMILGQPVEQTSYSSAAQLLGWLYHFSNGASFGVMYLALIGDGVRRHWGWAVLMAVGLELGMLVTPYPRVFNIPVTQRFVIVTMAVHGIFGVGLGLGVRWLAQKWTPGAMPAAVDTPRV